MSLTPITPIPAGGSWTGVVSPGITGPLTPVTPIPAGGSWTILTRQKTGFRNLGLTRGARSVT